MRRCVSILVLVLAVAATPLLAQETGMGPYITVSGFAEEWIDPDVAVWTVSIETDGKELKDLKRENDDEYERVLDVARALDVPTQHTTSGRIGVRRVYETDNHGRPGNFSHFQLTRQVKIEQHDIDRFEEFLDKLLMDGDLNVQLNYNLTTMGEVRERLKLQATYAARSKAEKLAAALGASVGGPLIVSEYPIITDYAQVDRRSMQAGMVSQSTPERIHVTEHIYVRFALLHGKKRAEKP